MERPGDIDALIPAGWDRANGIRFAVSRLMVYLAAPVLYVGIVQAAICDRLGASATVANLPVALSSLMALAPLLVATRVPLRLERRASALTLALQAANALATGLVLLLPLANGAKIAVVVAGASVTGFLAMLDQVYVWQCLKRGTTEAGRVRILKATFTAGPLFAVAGSLLVQFILSERVPGLRYPANVSAVYLAAVPCFAVAALACSRLELIEVAGEGKPAGWRFLRESLRAPFAEPALALLLAAYVADNAAKAAIPNLSLNVRQMTGREPTQMAGYILACRFGCKSLSGYLYGRLAQARGNVAVLAALEFVQAGAVIWALGVHGYAYLVAFALFGSAELAGIYYPNQCLAISAPRDGARNLALLSVAFGLGGMASSVHGMLADTLGFRASYYLALGLTAACLALVARLRRLI